MISSALPSRGGSGVAGFIGGTQKLPFRDVYLNSTDTNQSGGGIVNEAKGCVNRSLDSERGASIPGERRFAIGFHDSLSGGKGRHAIDALFKLLKNENTESIQYSNPKIG